MIRKFYKNLIYKARGSIALMSVLIIMAMVLIMVTGMSEANISTMYSYLNNESTQIASNGAEGCLEETLIRLEDNIDFAGGSFNIVDDVTCTTVVSGGAIKTITINVTYLNYTQNYSAEVEIITIGHANNASLISFEKT